MSVSSNAPVLSFVDPILCDFDLPIRATFHPLGFTLQLHTNSPDVVQAAEQSWQFFSEQYPFPPIEIHVGVRGAGPAAEATASTCRGRKNLLTTVADANNFYVADLLQGFGYAWVTELTAVDTPSFRYNFLEGMVLVLLGGRYLTPIHAACVSLDGRGILLCGDSGAGKSSLAYACARRGWTFTSDDASALIRTRADRIVVGNCHQIRFRHDAPALFPELRSEEVIRRVNGEFAIEVPSSRLAGISISPQASIDYVIFLNRRTFATPSLCRRARQSLMAWFEQFLCLGGPEIRNPQRLSLENLLASDPLELRYSDLDSAVACLESLVRNGL